VQLADNGFPLCGHLPASTVAFVDWAVFENELKWGTGLDRGAAQLRRRRPPVCSTSATAWESPRAATASSGPSTASCSSGSGHRRPPGPARARPVVSCPLSLKWDLHGCAYPLSAKWDPYCTSETHADGRAWWWCIA
jgi:hypothetical protein